MNYLQHQHKNILKSTFFDFITFRKNPGCYSLPSHENLVPEIKGFLGFRKCEGHWSVRLSRSQCSDCRMFSRVHLFFLFTPLCFLNIYLVFSTRYIWKRSKRFKYIGGPVLLMTFAWHGFQARILIPNWVSFNPSDNLVPRVHHS